MGASSTYNTMTDQKTQPPPRRKIVGDITAVATATNIDRRECKRVVPLKVLCLGASRTGTSSLRQALLDLGYADVYHYASIFNENPRDAEMWLDAIEGKAFPSSSKHEFTKSEWDSLLGHCEAVTDNPSTLFYKELLRFYPEAKVILTIRDSSQQWWTSQMRTVTKFILDFAISEPNWFVKNFLLPKLGAKEIMAGKVAKAHPMYVSLVNDAKYGTNLGMEWYEEYNEEIRRLVPKENLLVMNVKEGWGPLCGFLGKEVPKWEFPNVNTSEEFEQNVKKMTDVMGKLILWNLMKVLGGGGVVLASIGLASWVWW